jgi:hypothetical protein
VWLGVCLGKLHFEKNVFVSESVDLRAEPFEKVSSFLFAQNLAIEFESGNKLFFKLIFIGPEDANFLQLELHAFFNQFQLLNFVGGDSL